MLTKTTTGGKGDPSRGDYRDEGGVICPKVNEKNAIWGINKSWNSTSRGCQRSRRKLGRKGFFLAVRESQAAGLQSGEEIEKGKKGKAGLSLGVGGLKGLAGRA